MQSETLKLDLIKRLMAVKELSTLKRVEQLITQVEIESRTNASMKSIEKKDTLTLDELRDENRKWFQKKHTR